MLTTWILIVTIYLYGGFHGSPAMTSEQIEYPSQEACVAAAAFLQEKKSAGVRNEKYNITSFCIPGPRRVKDAPHE